MIPADFITEWRAHAPWVRDQQVEQDLILSRALVEVYKDPALAETLAFRGGTALYKLYLAPPARYSEDIDFVQIRQEPIGPTLRALRNGAFRSGIKRLRARVRNSATVADVDTLTLRCDPGF